jgi:molybdopterin molybdotransferase
MKGMTIGLKEAMQLMFGHIIPLPHEDVSLIHCVGRIAASDIVALIDSPSTDTSRKDGYAVISDEVTGATSDHPVRLRVLGVMAAGCEHAFCLQPGTAVRILTGARIPPGASAVVSDEFVKKGADEVLIESCAEAGNILPRGSDVTAGTCILKTGQQISPIMAGLLTVAGHSTVPVYRNPVVGILGTGDEILAPGQPLLDGKLYASNIITLAGWCTKFGMTPSLAIVKDDPSAICHAVKEMAARTDALLTSGGAGRGDYDMVARALGKIGWKEVFHRIRIGPGKTVGFGLLGEKPVFILPGGPPSNAIAFLQVALPGLLALSGHPNPGLRTIKGRLGCALMKGDIDWTDFFFGTITFEDGLPVFNPQKKLSRLATIAGATAIAAIPEGYDHLPEGSIIDVQVLD